GTGSRWGAHGGAEHDRARVGRHRHGQRVALQIRLDRGRLGLRTDLVLFDVFFDLVPPAPPLFLGGDARSVVHRDRVGEVVVLGGLARRLLTIGAAVLALAAVRGRVASSPRSAAGRLAAGARAAFRHATRTAFTRHATRTAFTRHATGIAARARPPGGTPAGSAARGAPARPTDPHHAGAS